MNGAAVQMSMGSTENKVGPTDVGQLVSCLGVKEEVFNVTWKPKVLKTDETVVFYIDIGMTQTFTSGKVCIQIWLDDIPDPIYDDCKVQFCDKFIQIIQPYIPSLTCPIKQGFHLKQVFPVKIVPTIPLPAGNYRIKFEVWNENNAHTLCITGNVEVEDE